MIKFFKKCGHSLTKVSFGISIAILLALTINYSWASTKEAKIGVVSLNVKNEPLKKVLDSVSRLTDYKIIVSERWEEWPVTVSFDQVTINRALKRIIGKLNHAIIYSAGDKIFITILDEPKSNIVNPKTFDSSLGMEEVIPPDEPGAKGVTQGEIDAILAQQEKIDPLDIEVIPSDEPGAKGVTQGEIDAILAQQEKIDPLDIEVIPSDEPEAKGVTQGEIDAILAQQEKIDPLDIEVIPPDQLGEKGTTQREIYAMKSNLKD